MKIRTMKKSAMIREKAAQLLAEAGWTARNAYGVLVKKNLPFTLTLLYFSKPSERHLTIFQRRSEEGRN